MLAPLMSNTQTKCRHTDDIFITGYTMSGLSDSGHYNRMGYNFVSVMLQDGIFTYLIHWAEGRFDNTSFKSFQANFSDLWQR